MLKSGTERGLMAWGCGKVMETSKKKICRGGGAVWQRAAMVLLWALITPVQGYCGTIDSYVYKYRTVELSPVQVRSIANFDRLIVYFSSIAYHRTGYKVNPDFIRALMLAESNGNPNAVSPKNALGLCQLLYPTAKMAASELAATGANFRHVSLRRLNTLQPEDLHDPAVNILLSCYLVAKYNALYGGRLDLVVAAWNAGEGAIVGNRPPDYPETLDLIGKINGYFRAFLRERRGRFVG